MKFYLILLNEVLFNIIYKTPLCMAIEKGEIEIIKLLLEKDNIDVNVLCVFTIDLISYSFISNSLIQFEIIFLPIQFYCIT